MVVKNLSPGKPQDNENMTHRAIIFDLDGTLLDTLEDLADATNTVLNRFGFPTHPVDAFKEYVGSGARELVRRALPAENRDDETLRKCHQAFLQTYACNWDTKTRPYPGIPELLDQLARDKIKTAILSNKPHQMAVKAVTTLLAPWHFEIVLGQRDDFPRKPDPAGALQIARNLSLPSSDFLFVGDSGVDMQTAVNAKMFPLGAAWGFRSLTELRAFGTRAIVQHPSEIVQFLGH